MSLTAAQRDRLVKVLALLASSHDGERAAASPAQRAAYYAALICQRTGGTAT